MDNIKLSDLSIEMREYLEGVISAFNTELENIHRDLNDLKQKREKRDRGEFTSSLQLAQMKLDFAQSAPHIRKDPFTDWELVFWATYILKDTTRREMLESIGEVAKRAKRIQMIVKHYKDILLEKGVEDKEAEARARIRTKDFIEFVLLSYPTAGDKPMTFYLMASPWAVNSFGSKLGSWQQAHSIMDIPAEDN